MIKFIIPLVLLTGLSSCDTRNDVLLSNNTEPTAVIKSNNAWSLNNIKKYTQVIFDTVKLTNTYDYNHQISDDNKSSFISIDGNYDGLILIKNGINFNSFSNNYQTETKTNNLTFKPNRVGDHLLNITTKDIFDKETTNKLYVNCFLNLPPVAMINVTRLTQLGNRNYEFDASSSFDGDAKYGGNILEYFFEVRESSVLQYQVTGSANTINYNFTRPGTFDISVKVRDNNNVWSGFAFQTITVS